MYERRVHYYSTGHCGKVELTPPLGGGWEAERVNVTLRAETVLWRRKLPGVVSRVVDEVRMWVKFLNRRWW